MSGPRSRFPELAGLAAALAPHQLVVDGEAVAFDASGRPSFGQLQHRMHLSNPVEVARVAAAIPVSYVIFDLLWMNGRDLTRLPYLERRELLAETVPQGDGWMVPPHHVGGGADLLKAATARQLEGIVVKRNTSPYVPGKRSADWRTKVKARPRQEFVIGAGSQARSAAAVSSAASSSASIRTRSSGTPAGWARASPTPSWPVSGVCWPAWRLTSARSSPVPPAVVRLARWVRPELVAEVAFAEWTGGATLRHPSYVGIRTDQPPRQVVRES